MLLSSRDPQRARCIDDGDDHDTREFDSYKIENIGKPLKYGFLFVKFLFLYVVCVVIMI